ncbi:MAG: PQQ-binding-like beta-propeller repeat protein, partial [Euryarchaeota archaeon]|nr:PQQ-binding-like beta-propeller repeat protein [Euryarchaeota archaeon]
CVNCNNNTFFDNTVGNNKFDGIYLSGSDNKVFYNTIITNNNDGISIPGSASILRGNLIHDNIISYNYNNGISLYGESTMQPNRIYSNNITNNSYGIHAFPNSNNNMIYHNNFKGNSPLNAWDDGWNTWDDSISEGNYWDNWGGGGWYSIPGPTGRFDHYPFNTPFAWRPSLNNAVDNAGVVLSTGGTAPWFGQKDYYHVYMNNNDSAQSGHVGDSQYSWLKTTVTGPVTLTFYWKVSSEINHDNLIFSVDGYEQARISGEIDWQQSIYTISSGSHQLQWNYTKDTSIDVGLDCGWIDLLDSTPNNPPNNPTSPSPANASTGISITADLSWTGGDPDTGDTVLYDVYFGTTNPSPKVSSNQSGTTYDTGTMNFNTMYYWKIVAWDNHGASTIGPLWNFTTKINNPPNIPSSPNPANSSTNVQITPILSWTGGDPDGDTVTYDVYFGFISPPSKVISNQSATTYNPGTLSYNTTYFWKIISWDNHSASTVGPIWQFTTQTTASPHWPMFRRMVNHTAYTSDQGPFTNNQLWVYTIGNTVISSPSVIDGVLYVGSADNKVYAFYASNGSKIWEYTTGSYIFSSPAVAEGKVYIGSFDNKIYALNANNGSKIWSYTTGEGVYSSPTIDNQIIYVGSDDNKIYALNAMNGSFIWSYTTGGDVRSSPAVVQNIVYVGADDGKLYAFYANNGTKKWENSIGCDRSSPAVDNGIVYIGSVNSGVYAVYANNGTTKWSYMIGTGGQVRSSPAIANGLLFIGSDNGKLYALNLSNGSKVWEKTLGDNGVRSSPAVAGNNIVYVGDMATTGGKIFALNASTGAEIWIYQTNMQIESSPAIVDNVMYTGGGQKVYAFGLPAKLSPVGQWPFNEGSGTIAYDQTSFHNDGTISGATWTTGYSGYALSFDGSSSKVTVLNSSSIDITEPFIVQTWINLTGAGDYYAIVDKYQYIDGSDSRGFTFYINSGHLRLSMYCGTHGSCDIQSPAGNLRDSKWHYVVGMWDGNYAKIFVDGKQNASAAWIYPPASTNNPLGIGQRLSGHGGTMPFQGKIDEVSISLLNNPPNIPTNPNPPNDATSVNRTTDLSWVGGDPDSGDVVKYDLYFGATNPPSKIISNQTSSTYDPGTMDYITTYYWRIVAWDSHNVSAVGPLWKFTTEVPPGFYLNLNNFPMYPAIGPNYTQMCGPAVAQMTLNYIWWNSSNFTTPPLTFDNQTWLYQRGKENNSNISLPYLDTQGLWHVIQYNKPMPYTTYGYNFNRYSNTNSSIMLKQICEWINYPIGTYGGYKAGYPLHVPAVVPAYGNYSNWMAVRGFNANHSAYPLPSNLTIYGFWVNDPMPNGIGANIYTTVNDWLATYYKPLQTTDQYNGKYVAICEPPETRTDTKLNIAPSPARFTINQKEAIALAQTKTEKTTDDLIQKINKWIIEAATTGATQQLSPYDAEFAAVFSQSVPGTPLFIKNLNGGPDYYAVPFSIPIKPVTEQLSTIRNNAERNTVVVIFINATDGSFKEASWTQEPMIYLPVSQEKATILVQETLNEKGIYLKDPTTLHIDLVYRGSSPYYPEWRITSEELGLEFLVNQEGRLS